MIRPFRKCLKYRATDRELLRLIDYLQAIAHLEDLSALNHDVRRRFLTLLLLLFSYYYYLHSRGRTGKATSRRGSAAEAAAG